METVFDKPLDKSVTAVADSTSTNDILTDAIATSINKVFRGNGSAYTGSLPDVNLKWGIFQVYVSGSFRYIIGTGSNNYTYTNFYNGSAWSGWGSIDGGWEQVTVTKDTSKIASGEVYCYKRHGMAFVSMQNVVFKASGNNQGNVVTGLPTSIRGAFGSLSGSDAANTAAIHSAGDCVWISDNSSVLNVHMGSSTYSKGHWSSFLYPCV